MEPWRFLSTFKTTSHFSLSSVKSIHSSSSYFLFLLEPLNTIHLPRPRCFKWFFSYLLFVAHFNNIFLYNSLGLTSGLFFSPMHATLSNSLFLLDLINLSIFGKEYKRLSALYYVLHPHASFFLALFTLYSPASKIWETNCHTHTKQHEQL